MTNIVLGGSCSKYILKKKLKYAEVIVKPWGSLWLYVHGLDMMSLIKQLGKLKSVWDFSSTISHSCEACSFETYRRQFRALGSGRMPIILVLVDTLASALGIVCIAADVGFEATGGFNSAS